MAPPPAAPEPYAILSISYGSSVQYEVESTSCASLFLRSKQFPLQRGDAVVLFAQPLNPVLPIAIEGASLSRHFHMA